ncbi:MAG: hypothetical protein SFY80_03045 [Verrucomicrobiota bacterium]|nr:hypothetical protein [Verrucomicrobiota bacterium]
MTSNTSPAPLVAGNSVLSALAYKAWDGSTLSDPGDMSGTGPWWWKIDLGAGNAIVPAAFRLRCGTSSLVGTIKDGLCLGSNDGVAWVLLASIINQTGWSSSTPRNFVVVANSTQEVIQNVIEYNPQYPDRFESARKYPLIVSKPGTVSYRWKCGGVVIPGQTGATLLAAYSPSPLETPHVREVTLTVDGVSVVHNSNEVILYES